jgi:TonB-linked SusC/RagA family outer membrane protein
MRKFLFLGVTLLLCALSSWAQRTVTGKVTDDKNYPLPNVTVQVKGTNTGTVTRDDGTFSLTVPANARTLVFSFADMTTEETEITATGEINATLRPLARSMQEIVVVGYGTQQRRQVTGAIGKIDPKPIETLVNASIDKALGGRTAGVLVTNPSGLVNEPPRIRIRGVNSISGSSAPLFVLDGVPVPTGGYAGYTSDNLLANINPADVESIEVLKDGSATAIYGSRASNGVILITTKKGKAGRSNLNYSFVYGRSKPVQRFDLLNAQEFVTIANEKLNNAGTGGGRAFMNAENTNTDWQDVVFLDPAISKVHNLSIDGGNDRTTYFFSLNYTDQDGLIKTNFVERYGIRANLEQKINKFLKLSNYITLSRTYDSDQNNGGNSLSGAVANALRALPNVRVYNDALPQYYGYNTTPDGAALGSDANTRIIENNYTNIAFVLDRNKLRSTKHRIINNFGAELKPLNWLTYTFRANVDYITLDEYLSWDARHGDGRSTIGRVQNQAGNSLRWVLSNYINANKSFGAHNFFLTVGYENQNAKSNSFQAIGLNLSDPFFQQTNVISGSYATQQSSGTYSEGPSFIGYFARLNYDFGGKYFVQGTFRRDGLSRFAEENRFGNFPGVSVGYRISQEDFFKNSGAGKFFDELKVRASWARVGNTEIVGGNFPYLSLYASAPYGAISGIAASQAGNAGLTWETNEKLDIGLDLGFWGNRATVNLDYYVNDNNGLVLAAPQPPSLGVPGNQIYQNIGDMENKGFEVGVNVDVIRKQDLTWNLGVNYTHQTNEVKSLYLNQDVIQSNGTGNYNILRVGEPINAIYGYRFAGVNSTNGYPVYYKADGSLVMGNISNTTYYTVPDVNGAQGAASSLAGTDRTILGNTLPTYFGGITSNLTFKGISFDMLWRYSGGNKIMNITRQESLLNQAFMNNGREILERWQKAGDVTDVPRLWYGRSNFTNLDQQAVDRFVEDGDFIRLDNLQLSYNLTPSVLQRISNNYIKSFRVFVQGQNLLVITNYSGIDPDNIDSRGLDYNTIPQAKTISFGLNIGF